MYDEVVEITLLYEESCIISEDLGNGSKVVVLGEIKDYKIK